MSSIGGKRRAWLAVCVGFVVLGTLGTTSKALAQNPWETAQGVACFERWIADSTTRLNAFNGDSDFNARKPWRVNQYGLWEGNPRIGPRSVYAPDFWPRYAFNRYWVIWDLQNPGPSGWTNPNWNRARVEGAQSFIKRCLSAAIPPVPGGPTPGAGTAQAVLSAVYWGMNADVVGQWSQATPNGQRDGRFSLTLDTRGARRVVNFVMLQSADAQGRPARGEVWDTRPGGYWILGVYRNGRRLNPSDQNISDVAQGSARYEIYGNAASGSFQPGQYYRITVRFTDGGEAVAIVRI